MSNSFLTAPSHRPARAPITLLSFFMALFLLASMPAAAQEAQQQSRAGGGVAGAATNRTVSASGSITGRVVGDDGRPASDVQVYIYGAYSSMSPRAGITDTSGRFQLKDLAPGLYTLRVNTPAYVEMPDENRSPWETRFIRPGESIQLTLVKGGVITGTVLNAQGEPLVAANVRAVRVRDAQGRRIPPDVSAGGMPRLTDDRGIYRIYGLQPGSYVVVAGGNTPYFGIASPYESDVPTYYPSSTRDTAMEVSVRPGEEATGVDIRYRGERGHAVSGTISGMTNATGRFAIGMVLTRATTGIIEAQTFVADTGGKRVFSLNGIADGEYEIVAQGYVERGETVASEPRRITVRGSDVTGLQIALAPLASISGRITLVAAKDESCPKINIATAMQETLVTARREDLDKERVQPPVFSVSGNIPGEQGEFAIRNLTGGVFRLSVRPPGADWYVSAVALPGPTRAPTDQAKQVEATTLAPGTIAFKTGERVSGITINLSQGAATLRGRVTAQTEGGTLPANLRAYLVPTERERADDILRYAETNLGADGSFTFDSLAPGRYWLALRPAPQNESLQPPRMLAWDEEARKALRREAEAAANAVELKPCQQLTDYRLSYSAK